MTQTLFPQAAYTPGWDEDGAMGRMHETGSGGPDCDPPRVTSVGEATSQRPEKSRRKTAREPLARPT